MPAIDKCEFTQEVDIIYAVTETPPIKTPSIVPPRPGSTENDILTLMLSGQQMQEYFMDRSGEKVSQDEIIELILLFI